MSKYDYLQKIDSRLVNRFIEFHEKNPIVYKKFVEYTKKIIDRGFERYSAWTIINVIRWEQDLETKGNAFRINNDFIALYARMLVNRNSWFKGFFNLREMKQNRRRTSKLEKQKIGELL
jgi:hypothetical protein